MAAVKLIIFGFISFINSSSYARACGNNAFEWQLGPTKFVSLQIPHGYCSPWEVGDSGPQLKGGSKANATSKRSDFIFEALLPDVAPTNAYPASLYKPQPKNVGKFYVESLASIPEKFAVTPLSRRKTVTERHMQAVSRHSSGEFKYSDGKYDFDLHLISIDDVERYASKHATGSLDEFYINSSSISSATTIIKCTVLLKRTTSGHPVKMPPNPSCNQYFYDVNLNAEVSVNFSRENLKDWKQIMDAGRFTLSSFILAN